MRSSLSLLLLSLLACRRDDCVVYPDPDGDGVGDGSKPTTDCAPGDGFVKPPGDCDNQDPTVGTKTIYPDVDGDGWGEESGAKWGCFEEAGWVFQVGDCDDGDGGRYPGNVETCDDVDNDCDGEVDNGASDILTWYADGDGDGYGDDARSVESCRALSGYVLRPGDCEDTLSGVNPDASAVCGDAVDNDCDGLGDCGFALSTSSSVTDAGGLSLLANNGVQALGPLAAGDVTGDGAPDVLVGAPGYAGGDGAVAVVPGRLSASGTLDQGWLLTGESKAQGDAGGALAVGYFNEDEHLDVVVGAAGEDKDSGAARLVFGPITESVDLGSASIVSLFGQQEGDLAGATLVTLDWNSDGISDLLVGAPGINSAVGGTKYDDSGAIYLITGPILTSDPIENVARGVLTYDGEEDAALGGVLADVGDLDNDGYPEIGAGMPAKTYGSATSGTLRNGEVAIFTSLVVQKETDLDLIKSYTFRGTKATGTEFGGLVAGAGDLSGDGYPEVLIGSPGARRLYVVDGLALSPMDGGVEELDDYTLATITGSVSAGQLGVSASGLGDLDGDDRGELVVGAPGLDGGAGGVLYFFGAELSGVLDEQDAEAVVTGRDATDGLGAAVVGGGDLNGLGLEDVLSRGGEDVAVLFSDRF